MLEYRIKCRWCAFTNIFQYMRNSFNNSRKGGIFSIDLVDSMLNTLRTLELANVLSNFYFHIKTLPYSVKPNYYLMIYV